VPIPLSKSGNATILAIDNKNRIFWRDTAYRAQGEHLKPLENAIHEVLYPKAFSLTKKSHLSPRKKLKIGDDAPDFILKEEQKLSDLKGKVVVLSFYPAAFSGILPKTDMQTATAIAPRTTPEHIEKIEEMSRSCIGQIYRLDQNITAIRNDTIGKEKTNIINVVVSSSTPKLLYYWEKVLKTTATIYANDKSYTASHIYDSYNKQCYNNRALYVIDKKGKIAYIEKNYEEKTNEKIKEVIKKLE
jgi:peroxiredoxin